MRRVALVVVLLAGALAAPARAAGPVHERRTFTNAAGSRDYVVHAPAAAVGTGAAVVVHLHGCSQNADDVARGTGWAELADEVGFVAVFPEQPRSANSSACWNWFLPDHMQRGRGEPSIIAGIAWEVVRSLGADGRRVYVAGLSGGGAMTSVVLATYPDLFRAGGIVAGCMYDGLPCIGAPSAKDPERTGESALAAMGDAARAVPFVVVQGTADATVPPANADAVFRQWRRTNHLAHRWMPVTGEGVGQASGGWRWTVRRHGTWAEVWTVEGMGHAWPGGTGKGTYTDAKGPDAPRLLWRFFTAR